MAHETNVQQLTSPRLTRLSQRSSLAIQLLALAGPVVATNISRTAMSFVDFVMVSRLGIEAQAAVMPAGLLLWCFIAFGMGLVSTVNTFAAQSLGQDRLPDCSSYAWQGLYLSLIVGTVFLPVWFLVEPFFQWANHGPEIMPLEVTYTRIGVLGIAPVIAATALSNFFTGIHRPTIGLLTAAISNVFNLVANYALIFGHWGFPAMGISGAAWATVAASVLHMVMLLGWMLRPHYAQTFHCRRTWVFRRTQFDNLVKIGLPVGVQWILNLIAWLLFMTFLVGRFGPVHLAANNICFKFLEISYMPAAGLGMALSAAVGKSIGQNRHDVARAFVRIGRLYCLGYVGVISVLMAVFRHELPALLTNDGQVVAVAGRIMIMCAIFQVFDGMAITYNYALRGAGDTVWPAVLSALCAAVLLLGGSTLVALFAPQWGSIGPWLGATVYIFSLGVGLWARFRFGPWSRLNLIGPTSAQPQRR